MSNPVKDMLRVRRVQRLTIHLEVEATGLENRLVRSAAESASAAAIALEKRQIAARIRKAID